MAGQGYTASALWQAVTLQEGKTQLLWCTLALLPADEGWLLCLVHLALTHELIFDFRGESIAESIERLRRFAAEVMPLVGE